MFLLQAQNAYTPKPKVSLGIPGLMRLSYGTVTVMWAPV